MKTPACFTDARNHWNSESSLSKAVVLVSLLLVVIAYLPTLQFDYVTQDQWRAFRYSVMEQTPYDRANACVDTIWKFYVQTGRPLVWMMECVEHAAVAKISDFIYLRPIALSVVVVTALYLGSVLAPIVGGLAMGVLAASAFLMAPAYSFMYLQGLPAGMVLVSVILAAASFGTLNKGIKHAVDIRNFKTTRLATPFFLFVSSCFMYPAWAFLVVTLALAAFCFDEENSLLTKSKYLLFTLSFYVLAAAFYYIFVKISVSILLRLTDYGPDLGNYEVAVQLNPGVIWQRILEAKSYFFTMPPLNFSAPIGLPLLLLGLIAVSTSVSAYKNKKISFFPAIAWAILVLVFGFVIIIASISPWLFSKMDALATRHLIPWYLFYCVVCVGLINSVLISSTRKFCELAPVLTMMFILVPVVAVQNKLSFLEVAVSGIEIQSMRSRLAEWLNDKGYLSQRYLLIVPPTKERPAFVEDMLRGTKNAGENAVLSSAKNPVSIPWMVTALLRERNDHPIGKSVELVSCFFDQKCANGVLASGPKVVIGITNGDATIKSIEQPFVINNSTLTSKQITPVWVWDRVVLPSVKASSQLREYGPEGLFMEVPPGWHAEQNPKYPQFLNIDLQEIKFFGSISFLPQDPTVAARSPKSIHVKASDDGKSWTSVAASDDVCVANSPGGWHNFKLPNQVKTRFLEIEIMANCGDPNFLTLRGLKIE